MAGSMYAASKTTHKWMAVLVIYVTFLLWLFGTDEMECKCGMKKLLENSHKKVSEEQ